MPWIEETELLQGHRQTQRALASRMNVLLHLFFFSEIQ